MCLCLPYDDSDYARHTFCRRSFCAAAAAAAGAGAAAATTVVVAVVIAVAILCWSYSTLASTVDDEDGKHQPQQQQPEHQPRKKQQQQQPNEASTTLAILNAIKRVRLTFGTMVELSNEHKSASGARSLDVLATALSIIGRFIHLVHQHHFNSRRLCYLPLIVITDSNTPSGMTHG